MTKLSVNVNKVATIRNARGGNMPNLIQVVKDCEFFGAEGITVHPRPDERHVRYQDVKDLKPIINTEFNIEGNPNVEFIELVCQNKPHQVTLVPDAHNAITSNAGWDTINNATFLSDVVGQFQEKGIRVSVFVGTDLDIIEGAKNVGADRVELYTEPYADLYPKDKESAIAPFVKAAECAKALGLGVNAGHDLSLENLAWFSKNIPFVDEVSIGHALICDALYLGLEETIKRYKNCLAQ
jgi:pyridoxine 5-phosphate synthase